MLKNTKINLFLCNKISYFTTNLKLKTMKDIKTVIAPFGTSKCSEYLTDYKEYELVECSEDLFVIKDDEGDLITCAIPECAHLPEGLSWIIKQTTK